MGLHLEALPTALEENLPARRPLWRSAGCPAGFYCRALCWVLRRKLEAPSLPSPIPPPLLKPPSPIPQGSGTPSQARAAGLDPRGPCRHDVTTHVCWLLAAPAPMNREGSCGHWPRLAPNASGQQGGGDATGQRPSVCSPGYSWALEPDISGPHSHFPVFSPAKWG